jgi:hypothetical protein
MLTTYSTKLISRPSPDAPRSVCPFCREPGRLAVVHVHGKATQRVVGCKCDRKSILPREG